MAIFYCGTYSGYFIVFKLGDTTFWCAKDYMALDDYIKKTIIPYFDKIVILKEMPKKFIDIIDKEPMHIYCKTDGITKIDEPERSYYRITQEEYNSIFK